MGEFLNAANAIHFLCPVEDQKTFTYIFKGTFTNPDWYAKGIDCVTK